MSYKDAGVDIVAGGAAVDRIKYLVEMTHRHFHGTVLGESGGFSGLFRLPGTTHVLGATTDGVGTKVLLAALLERHSTIGIDLVAMCVNDLVVSGLKPAAFLDYIAMEKQIPERTEEIVSGIAEGCKQAHMALIGGEMAEMPAMYVHDRYDLAGFAFGSTNDSSEVITGEHIRAGMKVFALPSSGVHANGFSLIWKVFGVDFDDPDKARAILATHFPELGKTLGEELLTPTKIYVQQVRQLCQRYDIAGLIHVTGGGLVDNPPRILPEGCAVQIDLNAWEFPSVFRLIERCGGESLSEMLHTFNMGLGMLVISSDDLVDTEAIHVGRVVEATDSKTRFIGDQEMLG